MMGMTLMKQVFDGTKGYIEMQGTRQDMSADDMKEAAKYNTIFNELLMFNSPTLKLDGTENYEGSDAYRLVDGNNTYLYDVQSGLKVAEITKKEVAPGQVMSQAVGLSEYKDYSGVKFPTVMTMNMGMAIKLQVTELKINEEIPANTFD
jgi:hypothetical protein